MMYPSTIWCTVKNLMTLNNALFLGLVSAWALAGCQAITPSTDHQATLEAMPEALVSVRAQGNEPFWRIHIEADQTLELSRLGEPDAFFDWFTGTFELSDWRSSRREDLALELSAHICHDTMTGMPYPLSAQLSYQDQVLQGCAGDPADLLIGPEWHFMTLNSQEVVTQITLNFTEEGRLFGSGGCNRYMAGYHLTGENLILSAPASTMMACESSVMRQEQAYFERLTQVTGFDIDHHNRLILLDGHQVLLIGEPTP